MAQLNANMAGYLQVPQRYANADPTEFRLKKAKADQATAVAEKYHQSAIDDEMAREKKSKVESVLQQVATNPELKTDEQRLQSAGDLFMGLGFFPEYKAVQKQMVEHKKEKSLAQKAQLEIQEKRVSLLEPIAHGAWKGGTIEALKDASNTLHHYGETLDPQFTESAKALDGWIADNPNATTPEIRTKIESLGLLKSERFKTSTVDLGDKVGIMREGEQVGSLDKGQSPSSVAEDRRFVIAESGRNRRHSERYKEDAKKNYLDKLKLELQIKKLEKEAKFGTPKERERAIEKKELVRSGANAINAGIRMWENVDKNPLSTASGWKGGINIARNIAEMFPWFSDKSKNPYADFNNDKALVAALAVDVLSGKVRLNSKFGQLRFEAALGAADSKNEKSSKFAIETVLGILSEHSGVALPKSFRERLAKRKGYDKNGYYIAETPFADNLNTLEQDGEFKEMQEEYRDKSGSSVKIDDSNRKLYLDKLNAEPN